MRAILVLLVAACNDPAVRSDAAIDAVRIDSPTTPAIDWTVWGQHCDRDFYGMKACTATDGSPGLCILMGSAGACEPGCLSQPGHATECPPDAERTENATTADGCWCKQR